MRLKLKYGKLLSSFAFKSNLRRYKLGAGSELNAELQGKVEPTKPVLKSVLELDSKRLKLKYDQLLSSFAFNFSLRRYTEGGTCMVTRRLTTTFTRATTGRSR